MRKNQNFAKYFSPRMLSIGPIHHGKENLRLGEHYKLIWTAMYLKESKQNPEDLCQKIELHIEEVKGFYTKEAIGDYNDNDLVWMLFVDGCSVLQIMQKLDAVHPKKLRIKFDQQEHVIMDLHLLENQVPYKVLELLSNNDEAMLLHSMFNLGFDGFLSYIVYDSLIPFNDSESWAKIFEKLLSDEDLPQAKRKPNHVLDFVRLMFLKIDYKDLMVNKSKQENEIPKKGDGEHKIDVKGRHSSWLTYKNIRELKAAGIQVRKNETLSLNNVSFVSKWFSGELTLPWFHVDELFFYIYLNMIAYEKCPDFHYNYDICSYLAFLDTLVDDANDLKELRLAGVCQNTLGSDEEVAKLLNSIGTELASKEFCLLSTGMMAYNEKYTRVRDEIKKHCNTKWKTWMAQVYNTHFSNPWSICAFLAAALALVLTAIQTWLAFLSNN